ncbi:MAG TPA: hypothetical protein VMW48_10680 [Vicinamibacterales bacterium]|nr:hypothetical protein [Vicinamibacterales bacterium]
MALDTNVQQSLSALKQGPVQVTFDPDGTPISLFAKGGVDLTFVRGLAEAAVDIVGVYDLFTTGDGVTFTLALPERSKAVLDHLFPEGSDGTDVLESATYRGFGKTAGQSQRTNAKKVRMRPWQTKTSAAEQIILWVVVPSGDATLTQGTTEPHAWSQEFRALPDPTQADGQMIGRVYTAARS